MKINILVVCMIGLLTLIGCKSDKSDSAAEATFDSVLPEGFDAFYNRFQTDSVYQLNHIVFPLSGMSPDVDGYRTRWSKDQWIIHKPYNDYNGTYQRSFESVGNLVAETINSTNGQVTMMRRFAKMSGEWNLIFYKKMGMYKVQENPE